MEHSDPESCQNRRNALKKDTSCAVGRLQARGYGLDFTTSRPHFAEAAKEESGTGGAPVSSDPRYQSPGSAGTDGEINEARISGGDGRLASVLRSGDRAAGVGVVAMIFGIFGRNGGVARVDGMFRNHAKTFVMFDDAFIISGDHIHRSGLAGDFKFAWRLQTDLT